MALEIKGVVILGGAIYSEGDYSVYVGYLETQENRDIAHYLIINDRYKVVEDSRARMFEARGVAQAYAKEQEIQDKKIAENIDIVELAEPDGNTDPEYKAQQRKRWSN